LRFTVRRPASAEVSPCCHSPSGGDVTCSVHVGVARTRVAGLALENRLALTVPGRDVPTNGASLRCEGDRDLLDPARGFVPQTRSQKAPTTTADAQVQTAFGGHTHTRLLHRSPRRAGHRTHIKGFNADRIEPARNIRGDLFDSVFASVGLTGLQFRPGPPPARQSEPTDSAPPLQPSRHHRQPTERRPGVGSPAKARGFHAATSL
jgi:hypothetical protein